MVLLSLEVRSSVFKDTVSFQGGGGKTRNSLENTNTKYMGTGTSIL